MNNKSRSTRPGVNMKTRSTLRTALLVALLAFTATGIVSAQNNGNNSGQRITPNFKDAEIGQVIEAVAAATGKTIIPDPRVRAQVTMLSQTPMTPAAFYEAFLALLSVHQFVAVESGGIIKIVPDANQRQMPNQDLPNRINPNSEEVITQVIAVQNVNAAQLVPVLRPLMPQNAHMAAYPAGNILILSDRASNVNRIMRIISRIDQQGDTDPDIIPLQNASAAEVVRVVNTFYQQQAAAEGGGASQIRVIADDRSNSVLIGGDKSARLRISALVAHLDTPLESGGDTRVVYLQYADAEKIATKLKEQISATVAITGGAPPPGGRRRRWCRRQRGPLDHHLGGAGNQRAGHHRACQGHAFVDVGDRQARHPPRAGAGGSHHRRRAGGEEGRARCELGSVGPGQRG